MLTLAPTARVFVAPGATDMRKSYDTLAQVTRSVLNENPLSGHYFIFCNRRRNRLKVLVWDGTGFWVLAKRLEKCTFAWPPVEPGRASLELEASELALLLSGLDLRDFTRRPWWRRPAAASGSARA